MQMQKCSNFPTNYIIPYWKQKLSRGEFHAIIYSEFRILQFLRIKILGKSKLCHCVWHSDYHLLLSALFHHSKEISTPQLQIRKNCSPFSITLKRKMPCLSTSFLVFLLDYALLTVDFKTTLKCCDIRILFSDTYHWFPSAQNIILCPSFVYHFRSSRLLASCGTGYTSCAIVLIPQGTLRLLPKRQILCFSL